MSQNNSASTSGSTSPTRAAGNINGRAGGLGHRYAPSNPSSLRETHHPPSTPGSSHAVHEPYRDSYFSSPERTDFAPEPEQIQSSDELAKKHADLRRRLTDGSVYQDSPGNYSGTATPLFETPGTPGFPSSYRDAYTHGGVGSGEHNGATPGLFGDDITQRTTQRLAKLHGVRHRWVMYIYYYVPFFNWIQQYKWSFVIGDLIAAFTMASFYIPMSLSYASNLAHIPAVNGMYAFAVNPLIYALLGSCPQMVVGPEAAGSLLTGNVVRDNIIKGRVKDEDGAVLASIAGVVTGVAGAILFMAGVARIGFLDNVLSRPFLRGFISAIGIVIVMDQLIPEMGLTARSREVGGAAHGSTFEKMIFLFQNAHLAHGLTCAVSFGSFVIIMVCREVKRRLQPKYPFAAYVPDRFLIVVLTTIMSWKLHWPEKGVAILGDVTSGSSFRPQSPFDFSVLKHLESALSTSFVIALLGFFESSVAAKSLGAAPEGGVQGVALSANRELVALGVANVMGGVFQAIPAFGGYGRSKVNASTGGQTPMSSIFLSLITIFCVFLILPAFYYIPKGVLSAMVSVVAWSLLEEAPHDLKFFWRIRGWTELLLISIVFFATIFYSLEVGIACGIGFSLLRVIRHATRPRIQILGRARGTDDHFENAEADPDRFELIEGCLIVKIPEPLTFANTGDLRNRLSRLLEYGTNAAHPALPRIRDQYHNKNIIFDVHGVTGLDGAGAQVLSEILQSYKDKGVRIFFCRAGNPRTQVWQLFEKAGIVDICGGPKHFVKNVNEAIRLTQIESLTEEFRDDPA